MTADLIADVYARAFPDRVRAKESFVSIPVSFGARAWHTAASLREPQDASLGAAIVIVHGSGGVDSRGQSAARALNAAGFATLELDLWAARGVQSPQERPKHVAETLPDAFAALEFLLRQPRINALRVGIMGFSWGGVVSMLSATRRAQQTFARGGQRFAAHAPLYPACWLYNTVSGFAFGELTGAPVFIQTGADDLYDDPDSCERLVASLAPADREHVTFATYSGATHAWDRREPDIMALDPMAHKGAGGEVPFRYNAEVSRRSAEALVAFFLRALSQSTA